MGRLQVQIQLSRSNLADRIYPIVFVLIDIPETHDREVRHVGEVGQGHNHVVLSPQNIPLYAKFVVVVVL